MGCYNCHFSKFLETKPRKGIFIPTKDWLLLINCGDKVTSGTMMSLYHDKKTFISYGPYFTHSIMSKGHDCGDCHMNEAVRLMKEGKKVPMAKFEGNNIVFWKGIIPTVHEKLDIIFLDKDAEGNWIVVEDAEEPVVQYFCFGAPLTDEQMKKLEMPVK